MMDKIVGVVILLLCLCSCAKDEDAIYYPVGNVDIERGGPALPEEERVLVAQCYNEEDYVLDTLAPISGRPYYRQADVYDKFEESAGDRECSGI